MIEEILDQRATTHGSFKSNADISQALKYAIKHGDNHQRLSTVQLEALDMILHKVARIVNGDCNDKDHWQDICGYSQLVVNDLS